MRLWKFFTQIVAGVWRTAKKTRCVLFEEARSPGWCASSPAFDWHLGSLVGQPFEMDVPGEIVTLCQDFREAGHLVVVVGGRVRDSIAGASPAIDWDLATSASYRQIVKLRRGAVIDTSSHTDLSLALVRSSALSMEITQFRKQHNFERGVGQDYDVPSAPLIDDLLGRDFTVNAMAYDPVERLLYDPQRGREDTVNRVLRSLPDPVERFLFDPIRILRGVRIAGALSLTIEEETESSMVELAGASLTYPNPRRQRELERIFLSQRASWSLEILRRLELLPQLSQSLASLAESTATSPWGVNPWELCLRALTALKSGDSQTAWAVIVGACAAEKAGPGIASGSDPLETLRSEAHQALNRIDVENEIGDYVVIQPDMGRFEEDEEYESPLPRWIARVAADSLVWSLAPHRAKIWSDLQGEEGEAVANLCAELSAAWTEASRG